MLNDLWFHSPFDIKCVVIILSLKIYHVTELDLFTSKYIARLLRCDKGVVVIYNFYERDVYIFQYGRIWMPEQGCVEIGIETHNMKLYITKPKVWLIFVSKSPMCKLSGLIQIMTWRWTCGNMFLEPMRTHFNDMCLRPKVRASIINDQSMNAYP